MDLSLAAELEQIVAEYRHLLEEHRREREGGTTRRRLESRLEELEERFERMLPEVTADEAERAAWRDHLHHGAPAPPLPPVTAPLLFKGLDEQGSTVELRQVAGGDITVEVDGALAERLEELDSFAGDVYILGDREFVETFDAPPEAVAALLEPSPPWEHAQALLDDGLIDRHFSLTPRGRRALHALERG